MDSDDTPGLPPGYAPPTYELRDFRIEEIALLVYRSLDNKAVFVMARMKAPASETGELVAIVRRVSVSEEAIATTGPEALTDAVKRLVVELLEHEVEEKLYRDGVRVFTPHPEAVEEVLQ